MTAKPVRRKAKKSARPSNEENADGRVCHVIRSPSLEIANVDMAIIGFMGRDFTVTGFANYVDVKSLRVDTDGNSVGARDIEFEQAYRETCSLRLSPSAVGQLLNSLIRALKDSDDDEFVNLRSNIRDILIDDDEGLN